MSGEIALIGQILQLAAEEDVDIAVFHRTVSASPHLAARVVKVANSAIYGMAGRINRLERAVLILGVKPVGQIASSVLIQSQLVGVQIPGRDPNALWMHSLEIGAGCELAARCLGWPLVGEAYLAGLLHDLGVLELYAKHEARYAELLASAGPDAGDLATLERESLGEDHGELLRSRAQAWGFPEALREVIGAHHDPAAAPAAHRPLAELVRAAHDLLGSPLSSWSDGGEPCEANLLGLGLSAEDIADLRGLLPARIHELVAAYAS